MASEVQKFVLNVLRCVSVGYAMCSLLSSSFHHSEQPSEQVDSALSTIQSKLDCAHESLPSFFTHARESCKDGEFLGAFYALFSDMVSLLPTDCLPDWLPALVNCSSHHLRNRHMLHQASRAWKMPSIRCVSSFSTPFRLSDSTTCR